MIETPKVEKGQVWKHKDYPREVRVVRVSGSRVAVESTDAPSVRQNMLDAHLFVSFELVQG